MRSRRDSDVGRIDAVTFLDVTLPTLLADPPVGLPSPAELELRPLLLHVGDRSWELRREGDGRFSVDRSVAPVADEDRPIEDRPIEDRRIEVRLTAEQVHELAVDQVTPIGLMTAGTLDMVRGRIGRLLDWWLVWRSVLDAVPIHRPGAVEVPADLDRSFTLDEDPDEILGFLESAGFVHLRGVFDAEEMERISVEMDAAVGSYSPRDGKSWWATVEDGTERLVRMQRFEQCSPSVAALLEDPRLSRIAAIAGCGHHLDWSYENRVEALFKPIGVVSGISDVPWHKDCSLGRHSYECCSLTVGISVTGAGPTSGQLRVVAGSHRALVWPSLLDVGSLDLPDVALATETGDVTVHLSCTLHMAQAPTEAERRVLYTGFRLPSDDADARSSNRRLLKAAREGAPLNTSQASRRVPSPEEEAQS